MKRPVSQLLILPTASIKDALAQFEKNTVGILFVVDESQRLIGSITDGDIRRAILKGKKLGLSVRTIMNPRPVSFSKTPTFDEAAATMFLQEGFYRCIPIVNDKQQVTDYVTAEELMGNLYKKKKINKKVLVVGGAGYIGSVLVRHLLSRGYPVRVLDTFLYGEDSIRDLYTHHHFEYMSADSRDLQKVYKAFDGVSAVIHLGEVVGDPATVLDEDYTLSVNYTATRNLAHIAAEMGIQHFIYASSCSVYGFGDTLFDEKSVPNPLSLYAKTKLACEEFLLSYSSSFRPTILRLSTVFGWSFRPRFDLALNAFCLAARQGKPIVIHGGNQWRPFVHVTDVARCMTAVLEASIDTVGKQIINVGNEQLNTQLKDVAGILRRVYPDATITLSPQKEDPRSYRVCFDTIKTLLGIETTVDIEAGLREMKKKLASWNATPAMLTRSSNISTLYPG